MIFPFPFGGICDRFLEGRNLWGFGPVLFGERELFVKRSKSGWNLQGVTLESGKLKLVNHDDHDDHVGARKKPMERQEGEF